MEIPLYIFPESLERNSSIKSNVPIALGVNRGIIYWLIAFPTASCPLIPSLARTLR